MSAVLLSDPQKQVLLRKKKGVLMKSKWKNPVIKRVISFMLVFAMCLTLVPDLAMAAAPQSITTAAEFAAMTADGSYRLDQDITLTTPYENDFSGTFDGNGHT